MRASEGPVAVAGGSDPADIGDMVAAVEGGVEAARGVLWLVEGEGEKGVAREEGKGGRCTGGL